MADDFTHWDAEGRSRMVDVGAKPATARAAKAGVRVRMRSETLAKVRELKLPKGDPFEVARVAGILAAKRTPELIPLCHPLALSHVDVRIAVAADGVAIEAEARCTGPTGVEMEALTAAAVAALTFYDMCKAVDKSIVIDDLRLLEKSGGSSGDFRADEA
ncbi:MAG TPA: cyclic pyranopterin monophosphate synthase MoaC [Acidobacteriota bacterium]|nr:cyclic pyranopterin monophosphate synthase MoaC [Acidobacteriota bacterium]HQF87764.1 cyclic pyranopterin monophosphate synthase MoaC [Acidobacteriota bacterium]HQG92480.1 cyclic pyranopterin monophosphate synthase MoaC [Acidobacteriota bacterium]